jgi:hypothetical protein
MEITSTAASGAAIEQSSDTATTESSISTVTYISTILESTVAIPAVKNN